MRNEPILKDEMSRTLALCRELSGLTITMQFPDGSRQVIRPTKAFKQDHAGLCQTLAGGREYKLIT